MVSTTVKGILQDLGSLSKAELTMIGSAVNYLSGDDEELVVESDYKIPFAALCTQLEVAGVRDKVYYKSFKVSAGFKNWTKSIKELELFIED